MQAAVWNESFLQSTRGRVLLLLRNGTATVEELAQALELTDNAVRVHLAALERDGLIVSRGPRREGTVGKPAIVYEITLAAETQFSRAYLPLLTTLLGALGDRITGKELRALMREVGRRLAPASPSSAPQSVLSRAESASQLLNALGGVTSVKREGKNYRIEGASCPLSVAVSARSEVCEAVRTMLTEVTGCEVAECCKRGEKNQCTFVVEQAG
jgi:predicted ArsR family transcriptional regulator